MPDDDVLTTAEAADFLKVSRSFLYQATRAGRIPAIKLGTNWRYSRTSLQKWIEDQLRLRGEQSCTS